MITNWKFVGYCLLGLLIGGCKENEADRLKALLSKPPYASITDSIEVAPKDAELYLIRGTRLSQNNLHELASADYEQAWKLTPNENTAQQFISNLMLVDRPAEAVGLLKECINKFPDNTAFRRRLSEVYAQVGEAEAALAEYNALLAKDSLDFESWYEKGSLLVQLKDTAAAIAAMERSYSLQPVNFSGLALANLYANTRNPKAVPLCDALIARDSTFANEATFLKGAYYSDIKQYDLALAQFELCIRRDWKFTDAYIEKGIVQADLKDYEKALETFRMAATVSNTSADAYYWQGRCYEALQQPAKAIENYQRAISLDRGFVEARERLKRLKG